MSSNHLAVVRQGAGGGQLDLAAQLGHVADGSHDRLGQACRALARFADQSHAVVAELGVGQARLAEARDALRANTEEAAARGVFGVPSFVADGEVFWGADALGFLTDFLQHPDLFATAEMKRIDALPVAATRKN